jgi:hypothetical protein
VPVEPKKEGSKLIVIVESRERKNTVFTQSGSTNGKQKKQKVKQEIVKT